MEFNGDRAALKKALSLILKATALPALAQVHLHPATGGGVVLVAAEEDLYIRLPLPGELSEPRDLTVSAASLQRGLRKTSAPGVQIGSDGATIILDGLPLHPAVPDQKAPAFPRMKVRSSADFEVGDFRRVLREVVPSICTDDNRRGLNGVHIERLDDCLRLVTTDGHRLAWSELLVLGDLTFPSRRLLPRAVARLLQQLIPASLPGRIRMAVSEDSVRVLAGSVALIARLTEGEFPNYRSVLPTHATRSLTVNTRSLHAAVRRLRPLTRRNDQLTVRAEPHQLLLTASDKDGEVTEDLPVRLEGEPLTFGMNPGYLMDVLKAAPNSQVSLSMVDALEPCTLSIVGRQDCRFVIMPMRL